MKESFENIILFKECLINTWKLIKAEIGSKTVLNMKRNRAYPEAQHGHDLPSLETPYLKLTLTNFSLNKQRKGSGNLGAHQRKEIGLRNERRGMVFIGKVCHQLHNRVVDVQQP